MTSADHTGTHIVVIGAGVGGLGAALALSRDGHRVTMIERDATPTPTDPDSAFAWDRRGAPQVRHSHALLARLHNLLRDRFPDVLEALLEAGATEIDFCANLPPEITDRAPREGDDLLVALACRRTTFEWVVRTAVLADPHVTLLDGVTVEGLVADPAPAGGVPVVTGVRIARDGAHEVIDADLVVAATGRRTGVPHWLGELGIDLQIKEEDTGIVYLSRFYRLRDGVDAPDVTGVVGGDLGYLKYAIFQGDNRTYSVTFAVRTHDDELRRHLLDPDTFDHATRILPATTAWAAAGLADPITPVHVMAGLLNRRIRYRTPDGEPVVHGFHAIGDAHTCTNPLYGRGCSLAMVQATLLADALAAHPDDPRKRSIEYEDASGREVEPWYRAAVAQDRFARTQPAPDAPASDAPDAGNAPMDDEVESQPDMVADLMRDGLFPAVRTDPVVFRAFIRAFNLLQPPDALMNDPDVIARVLTAYQDKDNRPPEAPLGPPRAEMLELLQA